MKQEVEKQIKEFFKTKHKPAEVKKIKRIAMRNLIKLGENRKKFCKKCYSMDLRDKSIKNKLKTVECRDCKYISRYKIKN